MPDKIIPFNEQLNKRDLEIILEVNRKAVEIETAVADQNEDIISALTEYKAIQADLQQKTDKLLAKMEDISRDLFKIQVLYITGILAFIGQIIQIFLKK